MKEKKSRSNHGPYRETPGMGVDRLPPHSHEVEQAVLGTVMIDPPKAYDLSLLGVEGASFYDLRHRQIWEVLVALVDQGKPVDLVSLSEEMKDRRIVEAVGGYAYLSGLPDATPTSLEWEHFGARLLELHRKRSVIQCATNAVADAYDGAGSSIEIAGELEDSLLSLPGMQGKKEVATKDLVADAIASIEAKMHGKKLGMKTRFTDLDIYLEAFEPGDVMILAGRPSTGKTSLAMEISTDAALGEGENPLAFSLEMSGVSVVERMLLCSGHTSLSTLKLAGKTEVDQGLADITSAATRISQSPLQVCDSAVSMREIQAEARKRHIKKPVTLIIIDYLQLVRSEKRENRQLEVADVSTKVKHLAKELNVRVILISQLSRGVEKERRSPRLSDLRESGAIEQDADLVFMLWDEDSVGAGKGNLDEDMVHEARDPSAPRPVNITIAKNRNGPTGVVPILFIPDQFRFESACHSDDQEVVDQMHGLPGS
jgi:replicative DNA helicase